MSATGRSDVREKDDFYQTPTWVTRAILKRLAKPTGPIIDLGCGTGAIGYAMREWWGTDVTIVGVDFHEGRLEEARGKRTRDGLQVYNAVHRWDLLDRFQGPPVSEGSFDLVISNPPFKHAMEFVDAAMHLVSPWSPVAFLLRLAWIASAGRARWHRQHPAELGVLPERAGFYPARPNDKDNADYAWFGWGGAFKPSTYSLLETPAGGLS